MMDTATTAQSAADFNRIAQACTAHRMRQISFEAFYPYRWSEQPTREEYRYKCFACGLEYTIHFENKNPQPND